MPRIIMNRAFIARWTRMPHSIGQLSVSASSHHSLPSAAFITNIAESDFRHAQVVIGIYGTDPLVHARSIANTLWLQRRVRKGLVQIADDGACLVNCEITMLQDWHAVEGMQRQMAWLAHVRLQIMERVWHLLVREDEPHNVDESAARKAVYNEFRHAALLRHFCHLTGTESRPILQPTRARLRDAPAEWSLQFERLGLAQP